MAEVVPILAKQGITLQIVSFSDYIQPNVALSSGDLDANLYQNIPFMDHFNRERGTHFVSVTKAYLPPMGVYPGRTKSLDKIPEGGIVSIPNDPVNAGRGLLVLQSAGLLKLKVTSSTEVTVNDISENPRHLQIRELEAAQLPRSLPDVDVAVINANFALDAGLNPLKDSLYHESDASLYANVLAVNSGKESDSRIQALAKALTSPPIKTFIETRYKGAVIPTF